MFGNSLTVSKFVNKLGRILCGDSVRVQSRYSQNAPSYVQGQSPEPRVREYFYYIDHQGMLFLDDAKMKNFTSCFKEKKFLEFFFKRLRMNTTGRYRHHFPYVSLCGRERNFVRCDDLPVVFTHVLEDKNEDGCCCSWSLCYGHAGDLLSVTFEPDKVIILADSGRVYHPAPQSVGGVGLVRSKLAIDLSRHFSFEDGHDHGHGCCPTHFTWDGQTHKLSSQWYHDALENRNLVTKVIDHSV